MTDVIKNGDKVKVEYTGKLNDGTVFDSSKGRAPLCFEIGAKQVIPGFEKAVEGMKKDEEKTFKLSVEEGYGPVNPELVQEIPRDKLPKEPQPEVGMMLMMQAPTGQQIPAKITKVDDEKVTIDINHPLAGKELSFEIKVVGINEPEDENEDSCGCDCDSCNDDCDVCDDDDCEECDDDNEESGCSGSCAGCHGCN